MYRFLFLLILYLPFYLSAQSFDSIYVPNKIKAFGNHLFEQKDYLRAAMELERYLFLSGGKDDSTLFKIGLCHQLRGRNDFAVDVFLKIANSSKGDLGLTSRLAVSYNLAKIENWEEIKALGHSNDETFYFYYLADVMIDPFPRDTSYFNNIRERSFRKQLLELEENRHGIKPKTPLLASILSTVVPGLGKFYLNRSGDALFSFVMTNLSAFATYKAFKSNRNITGVVTSGMTLSSYFGTIYGSYIGAKLFNKQLYNKWRVKLDKLNPVEKESYW